jgi:hypothetical protein
MEKWFKLVSRMGSASMPMKLGMALRRADRRTREVTSFK